MNISNPLMRFFNKIVLIPLKIREKILLRDKNFILISNNCWGYSIYNTLNRHYNTPFVGLFILPEDYVKLLKSFPEVLNEKLKFINNDLSYPVAYLGDEEIEIHFLHYESSIEAQEKWSRRVDRLFESMEEKVDLFVKLCDGEGCTKRDLEQFHALDFKNKISITINEYAHKQNIYVPYLRDKKTDSIVNGLQLFKNRYRYFDFTYWLATGKIRKFMRKKH